MTTSPPEPAVPIRPVPGVLDEGQAAALGRLLDRYGDALAAERRRRPAAHIPVALHAVVTRQARQILDHEPLDRAGAGDVADALALIRAARADIDQAEGALLLAARHPAEDGRPLLAFRRIAAALALESEHAAQDRYRHRHRHRVGNLNGTDSGLDGTP